MQIQSISTASALIPHRSSGSQGDNNTNGINPADASARDKQSDDRKQSLQKQAIVESANKIQAVPNLQIQRVTASKPVSNEVLASSTHSAKRAVKTFQQIDLLSESELMPRVDIRA